MGRPVRRKKQHKGDKPLKEKYRTRRRTKDHDQIHVDLKPDQAKALLNQAVDLDVTGNAQHYCLHCAKYFVNDRGVAEALRGEATHKRRVKGAADGALHAGKAERAAGMGNYIAPRNDLDVRTQDVRPTKMDWWIDS